MCPPAARAYRACGSCHGRSVLLLLLNLFSSSDGLAVCHPEANLSPHHIYHPVSEFTLKASESLRVHLRGAASFIAGACWPKPPDRTYSFECEHTVCRRSVGLSSRYAVLQDGRCQPADRSAIRLPIVHAAAAGSKSICIVRRRSSSAHDQDLRPPQPPQPQKHGPNPEQIAC